MKIVLRYLGFLLLISSFFRIIPIITGIIYNENVFTFYLSATLSLFIGLLLIFLTKEQQGKLLNIKLGFIIAALSFLILPLFGAISFIESFDYNFLDAYFEAISGFTTTGLTLYSSLDELPKSLLIWRAETQWMGGIGIVIFLLFLSGSFKKNKNQPLTKLEETTKSRMVLYQAQGYDIKLESGLKASINRIIYIYMFFTIIGTIALYLSGVSVFESISLTFTSLSTGGFSVTNDFYSNGIVLGVLVILMIIGSISFISHNLLLRKRFKEFFLSYERNVFLIFLIVGMILASIVYPDFKTVVFEVVSAFTTTGYSITNLSILPHLFIMVIFIAMLIGGSMVSTSGGIKVNRVYTLIRSIPWFIKKKSSPRSSIIPFRIHDKEVDSDEILSINIFIFTYLLIIFTGTVIFLLYGFSFLDSSFQMVSALGTVGLQTINLTILPVLLKIILIITMVFGRLEIFPLLILFSSVFKKRRN